MKFFAIPAAVLLISIIEVNCMSEPRPPPGPPGPLSEEMKKNFDECRTELGLTIEEERELHRKHDFKNEKMRCMPACLMKKDGALQAGNKIDINVVMEKMSQRLNDVPEDAKKKIEDCYEEAKGKEDECEFAQSFAHCSHKLLMPRPKGPE